MCNFGVVNRLVTNGGVLSEKTDGKALLACVLSKKHMLLFKCFCFTRSQISQLLENMVWKLDKIQ